MSLAVRTIKIGEVKNQLLSMLDCVTEAISATPTKYAGITLLNLDKIAASTLISMRNIEVLLIDEAAAAELVNPNSAEENYSFKSLASVDEREQYEHLSQLLHIQKATRDKR